jgi:hypothetical protein
VDFPELITSGPKYSGIVFSHRFFILGADKRASYASCDSY